MIYLIGSLRNPLIPSVAKQIREATSREVFDDWFSPGPRTDEMWQDYEKQRGRTYVQALNGKHADNAFAFDYINLSRCAVAVLVAPAGKSAHLELGWILGRGKPGYILLPGEPDRYDLMYKFATGVFTHIDDLLAVLK